MFHYYMGPMSWGWPFGLAGSILSILFWVFIVFLIISLFRGHGHWHDQGADSNRTPLDILKVRYAKGEITKKEYEEMKKEVG